MRKSICFLNRAITPDLQKILVSDNQGLEKMNHAVFCIFDVNHHKVVTKFYICKSKGSTAKSIFAAVDNTLNRNKML